MRKRGSSAIRPRPKRPLVTRRSAAASARCSQGVRHAFVVEGTDDLRGLFQLRADQVEGAARADVLAEWAALEEDGIAAEAELPLNTQSAEYY